MILHDDKTQTTVNMINVRHSKPWTREQEREKQIKAKIGHLCGHFPPNSWYRMWTVQHYVHMKYQSKQRQQYGFNLNSSFSVHITTLPSSVLVWRPTQAPRIMVTPIYTAVNRLEHCSPRALSIPNGVLHFFHFFFQKSSNSPSKFSTLIHNSTLYNQQSWNNVL